MMKTFRVEYELEVTQKVHGVETVKANTAEEAEKEFKSRFTTRDGECVASVKTREMDYKTDEWHDVEDVLTTLDDWIEEEKNGDNDQGTIDLYESDKNDWVLVIDRLIKEDYMEAANIYSGMDTGARELIPDTLYELFDARGYI